MFNNACTSILFNETKESFAQKADFYSNCMCVQREKKLIDMKRFNMKRFVKNKNKKKHNLFCLISQSYMALNSRENQAEIFHWSFVNSYLHLRTWLLLLLQLSYFHYGDITVPRHCGKCFYDFLTSPRD